jgi:hypothetical protein
MTGAQITLTIAIVLGAIAVIAAATKFIQWIANGWLQKNLKDHDDRLIKIETRIPLLWGLGQEQAMTTLHHMEQPFFDYLIEGFGAHTLTAQELDQFIERLEVVKDDPLMTAQTHSATLMLEAALAEKKSREGLPGQTVNAQGTAAVKQQNIVAAETMRVEAEPQRGNPDDTGDAK